MTTKKALKTNFAVDNKHEAFYTGGQVLFAEDGHHMLCRCTEKVHVLAVDTGTIVHSYGQEEDGEVTCFMISPDIKILVLALKNLQLKQFDFEEKVMTRSWKAIHTSPVSSMAFDSTSTLLATGGSDATVKVWDVIQQYCTHNLRGSRGVVNIVKYHPDPDKLQLFSGGEDYNIRVWDLRTSKCITVLEGHYSVITGLHFSCDALTLYSSGRDKVVNVWNLEEKTKTRTIPVYETVEAMILLAADVDYSAIGVNPEVPHFITAGSKGVLRVWNARTSQCVFTQNTQRSKTNTDTECEDSSHNILDAIYCPSLESIATVSYDHNIILYNRCDLSLKKQFAGYNDEILDAKYLGGDESHLVVATNSPLIKVFELKTWDVHILYGHTDVVLALDVYKNGQMFASSSKDNTIRVWQANSDVSNIQCVATAYGHTKEILSLSFSKLSASFLTSASEDLTIKVWNLPTDLAEDDVVSLNARMTEKVHDKDINAIMVAPNDKLIATGSQDKTAKLWSASSLKLLGVFRGHKRGIWCVQFSPVDQCLATSSSDGSVKIWSLSNYTCVRTFEGHDALVLKVQFINRGMQLLTSGSDGLMKLWTIKTNECVKTFDEHESKVWALAVNKNNDQVITGAGDSTIIVWKDVTETELEEERAKQVDFLLKEQTLLNLIQQKKYIKALRLAINLEQPFRVLNIMKEILGDQEDKQAMKKTLAKLRQDQLDAILRFSVQWNTNSKHCHVAQFVVMILLQTLTPEDLLKLPNAKSALEGLLPYTEKHFERMNRLLQQAMFVEYTWNTMRLASDLPASDAKVAEPSSSISGISSTNVDNLKASSDNSDKNNIATNITNKCSQKSVKHKTRSPQEGSSDDDDCSSGSDMDLSITKIVVDDSLKHTEQKSSEESSDDSDIIEPSKVTDAKSQQKNLILNNNQESIDSEDSDNEEDSELSAETDEDLELSTTMKTFLSKNMLLDDSESSSESDNDSDFTPKTHGKMDMSGDASDSSKFESDYSNSDNSVDSEANHEKTHRKSYSGKQVGTSLKKSRNLAKDLTLDLDKENNQNVTPLCKDFTQMKTPQKFAKKSSLSTPKTVPSKRTRTSELKCSGHKRSRKSLS